MDGDDWTRLGREREIEVGGVRGGRRWNILVGRVVYIQLNHPGSGAFTLDEVEWTRDTVPGTLIGIPNHGCLVGADGETSSGPARRGTGTWGTGTRDLEP